MADNKCKRCIYFDRWSDNAGLCDKWIEEKDQNYYCNLFILKDNTN